MNFSQSYSFSKMYQIYDVKEQERKAQFYISSFLSIVLSVLVCGQR